MASYNSILRHVDMTTVKRNTLKLQEQRREEERCIEEVKRAEAYKNSPLFSDWRFDLSENMTTLSMTYATTLPGTGDAINRSVNTGESSSFTGAGSGFENTYAKITLIGGDVNHAIDFTGGNGAFPGAFGDNAIYLGIPYTGQFYPTIDNYNVTTQTFEVTDTTVSFEAIAGNSTNVAGTGLGSNGGSKPLKDLSVGVYVFNDKGEFTDYVDLGVVPKTTTTKTKFTFGLPTNLFGKNISLNFYNSTNEGAYRPISWMNGSTTSFHPTPLDSGMGTEFTSELAWCILNYDTLASNNYYKQFSETTIAYFLWSDLQKVRTGDSDWGDVGDTTNGYPAPVSGGTLGLWADDNQDPPQPNPSPMTQADLQAIVSMIRSQYANQMGMSTTTYAIGNLNFQRKTPITVFVPLDSPDAVSFVRTDLDKKGLTPEERLKKIQTLLDASDEYLAAKFGDAFPGTGVILDTSFDEISDSLTQPGWEDAAADYLDGGDELLKDLTPEEKTNIENDLSKLGLSKGEIALVPALALPLLANPAVQAAIAAGGIGLAYELEKQGAGQALVDSVVGIFGGIFGKGGKGKSTQPPRYGGYNDDGTPAIPLPGESGYKPKGGSDEWPKGSGGKFKPGYGKNPGMGDTWEGPDYYDSYKPIGKVLSEKKKLKSVKDVPIKSPKSFFNDKDIKPEFPENPPPPQIKGLHPDLVTGEKVSQRFNRLDPISAKAMPRTGIKAIDKKVAIAKKKPK